MINMEKPGRGAPLSAARGWMYAGLTIGILDILINGLLIHVLAVGIPAVWFASRISSERE